MQSLYETDFLPMRVRAHGNAPVSGDNSVMVLGTDASGYYTPVYIGSIRYTPSSGDVTGFTPYPSTNPRVDLIFASGDGTNLTYRIVKGVEAASPVPPLVSGDTIPLAHVYQRVGSSRIVNFEQRNASSGDSYILRDVRPWLKNLSLPNPFGTPALDLGTSNSVGSGDVLRAGASVAAFDGVDPATLAAGLAAYTGGSKFAGRRDHRHPITAGVPALNFGTSNSQGSGDFMRAGAGVALFSTALPADSGTPSAGSVNFASRADHVHQVAGSWTLVGSLTVSDATGGTISGLDLDTHKVYKIVYRGKMTSINVGSGFIRLEPNASLSTIRAHVKPEGDETTLATSTNAGMRLTGVAAVTATWAVGDEFAGTIFMHNDANGSDQPYYGQGMVQDISAVTVALMNIVGVWDGSTNLTSLKWSCSGADDRFSGRLQVYRPTTP